jgi:hypothetical protein
MFKDTEKFSKWKGGCYFIPVTTKQITTINTQIPTESPISVQLSLYETFLDPNKYAWNRCKIPVMKTFGCDVSQTWNYAKGNSCRLAHAHSVHSIVLLPAALWCVHISNMERCKVNSTKLAEPLYVNEWAILLAQPGFITAQLNAH